LLDVAHRYIIAHVAARCSVARTRRRAARSRRRAARARSRRCACSVAASGNRCATGGRR
jgi:hypothetical protein